MKIHSRQSWDRLDVKRKGRMEIPDMGSVSVKVIVVTRTRNAFSSGYKLSERYLRRRNMVVLDES